ncbi:hypothetical protein ACVOZ6_003433 [Escherichia coli]
MTNPDTCPHCGGVTEVHTKEIVDDKSFYDWDGTYIGRIAEDNPDLPFAFINEILMAKAEINNGQVTRYVRRKDRT